LFYILTNSCFLRQLDGLQCGGGCRLERARAGGRGDSDLETASVDPVGSN
jgi:hypothetical protein